MAVPDVVLTDGEELAHTRYRGEPTPARAKLAFFRFGTLSVELIEPVGGPSTWRDQLVAHGDSLHHIAFRIQNMPQVLAALDDQGVPAIQQGDYTGGHYAYCDGQDRLGLVLELLEDDKT
jgi:catechol 2,3-dioxygenase-like lactoylglutathione lyase family enzyme